MTLARIVAAAAALVLAIPAAAQESAPPQPPRLVVAIAVDQLSADLFAQHRQDFTGGLARLTQGVVFPAGYQAHAATETCPGHSTILTGNHPAHTGIIANNWFDMDLAERDEPRMYCAEDTAVPGSTAEDYTVSASTLLVPTLGDLMKAADPESRVVAVSGKDRGAVMMGGHDIDEAYWPGQGGFTTFAGRTPAPAVAEINALWRAAMEAEREAMPMPPACAPYYRAIPAGGEDESVGTGLFARGPGGNRAILASPEGDMLTLNLAADLVADMELGQREATDLLAISLSSTDYVGHAYGTEGSEMCVQLMALDAMLGDFFARLDARGIDYVAVLTADHGGLDLPERQAIQAAPDAARLQPGLETLNARLSEETGLPAPLIRADGPFGDFYVDRSVPEERRSEVRDRAIALVAAHPQVHRVFAREEIAAQPMPSGPPENWLILDRLRASFNEDRSGDFLVVLNPRVTPSPVAMPGRYVATHGSAWDYDRRVPILFWWNGAEHFEQPLGVMTVDIMPTLASLIGLDISQTPIDGRCLDLMAGAATNCPAAPAD